ncbi:hypothetical protein ACLB2K_011181 [Fragaria x ananassa]
MSDDAITIISSSDETVINGTYIKVKQESVPYRNRGGVGDDFILVYIGLYRGIGARHRPDPDCPYNLDSETLVATKAYWVNLPGIKKVRSRYRSRFAISFKNYLSSMEVTQREQDATIHKLFEVLDVVVNTDLPITVKILDLTLGVTPEMTTRFVPATRESIEGLERVRLDGFGETCAVCLECYDDDEPLVTRCSYPQGGNCHGARAQWHISDGKTYVRAELQL